MGWFVKQNLLFLMPLVFLVRLLASFLPSFSIDMGTWLAWAQKLVEVGPANFYSDEIWTQYTPGFLYWLWFGGAIGWINDFLVKLPVIFADIFTGGIIWWILQKRHKSLALAAFLFYTLNPAIVFTGSVWGQIDGLFTLLLLLSVFSLVERKNIVAGAFFWAIAFLVKPQAIALILPLAVISLITFPWRKILLGIATTVGTILLGALPFFPQNPIFGLPNLIFKMASYYSYTSVFAFNFWSLVGTWRPDLEVFWGIPYFAWGALLYSVGIFAVLGLWYKSKLAKNPYLLCTLSLFAFFLFPTRVHERYIFPALAFILIAAGFEKSKKLLGVYLGVSTLSFANFYYSYAYYTENFLKIPALVSFIERAAPFIGIGFIILFILSLLPDEVLKLKIKFLGLLTGDLGAIPSLERNAKIILLGILTFAFLTRVAFLNFPEEFYFDEVYHAFTAREILRGNPAAWEYWATPPEGVAFEWTHPPLAKLGMAAGMMALGQNPVGWRLPGALLGVGTVLLVYLIGRLLFKQQTLALLASGLFALDGLPLVMSRIGMNDIYFLFFALLTIYLFLKDKPLFSALALGLTLSSKWTTFWILPILLVGFFLFRQKIRLAYLSFLVVPPIVYLGSYLPFFLSGHTLSQFIELQKQMWWYHTQLSATHPFWSTWWSWPLNQKPVWVFTESLGEKMANIYASGNPVVFFGGLAAVGTALVSFIRGVLQKRKDKTLLFLLVGYFGLFLPWAASPRIMFLYHYLPALPFLSLVLAWLLLRLWQGRKKWIVIFYLGLVVATFFSYSPLWLGIPVPSFWSDFLF